MIAALEPIWWAQGITNVLLCVAWLQLKRRLEERTDTVDQRMEFLCDRIERMERSVAALEAAERARKELTK